MDYMQLKKRLGGIPSHPRKAHRSAFVELVTSRSAVPEHCVIEFESSTGGKMRVQWKGLVRA
jgi:hypothetical protein